MDHQGRASPNDGQVFVHQLHSHGFTTDPKEQSSWRRLYPKSPALFFQCPYPLLGAGMPKFSRHSLLEYCSLA